MIVAQKMERPVHQQPGKLAIEAAVSFARLSSRRLEADDDVSQHSPAAIRLRPLPQRESENVGRAGAAAVARIQIANRGVVHEGDGEFRTTLPQFSQDPNGAGTEQAAVDGGQALSVRRAVEENRHFALRSRSSGPPPRVRSP